MAVVSFDVVTFHARGAWPYRSGEMTHSADGTVTLASGEIVSFATSRYFVRGEGTSYTVALYSARRRELTAAKWDALKGEIRRTFKRHVERMADGPRPAAIYPAKDAALVAEYVAAAAESGDAWHIANAAEHAETLADGGLFDADATRAGIAMARAQASGLDSDELDSVAAGLDPAAYASPIVLPRVGGFAPTGNIAPIGRAFRAGEIDSFQARAILDWMSPARFARFVDRWTGEAR